MRKGPPHHNQYKSDTMFGQQGGRRGGEDETGAREVQERGREDAQGINLSTIGIDQNAEYDSRKARAAVIIFALDTSRHFQYIQPSDNSRLSHAAA